MIDKMEKALAKVRSKKPLILCLTNFVTVEFVANSLLSIGAAPIMSTCEDEIEELVKMSSALYINIGTLDHDFIGLAKKAIEISKKYNKPIIFDPVGSGATTIRTEISKSILPFAKFIRGNSSEIISLAGNTHTTYGVEAYALRFLNSLTAICKNVDVTLIGGDTTASNDRLFISITAIGTAPESNIKYRNGAKASDLICVIGNLGFAHLGFLGLEQSLTTDAKYINSFLRPEAKIKAVSLLKLRSIILHILEKGYEIQMFIYCRI